MAPLDFLGGPRLATNRGVLNLGMGVPQGDRNSQVINDGSWSTQTTYSGGGGWDAPSFGSPGSDFPDVTQSDVNSFVDNGWWAGGGGDGGTATTKQVYNPFQETPEQMATRISRQNAYNTTQMGGYQGGVINSSYGAPQVGNPFQVNDPSAPGASMPYNQPWGQPGYGGPMGGAPTGSYGAPATGYAPGQMPQGSGWGGVFSNKNPWASS